MTQPANTPEPPYYSVVFVGQRDQRRQGDDQAYSEMAGRMAELATRQPGYLGVDSARGEDGFGITVSYWQSLEAIAAWKADVDHQEAQRRGREDWYEAFSVHIGRVERAYDGP